MEKLERAFPPKFHEKPREGKNFKSHPSGLPPFGASFGAPPFLGTTLLGTTCDVSGFAPLLPLPHPTLKTKIWCWPNLVLAKLGLAKLGHSFGQTWFWPKLVTPRRCAVGVHRSRSLRNVFRARLRSNQPIATKKDSEYDFWLKEPLVGNGPVPPVKDVQREDQSDAESVVHNRPQRKRLILNFSRDREWAEVVRQRWNT